jgi:hypothetical protein
VLGRDAKIPHPSLQRRAFVHGPASGEFTPILAGGALGGLRSIAIAAENFAWTTLTLRRLSRASDGMTARGGRYCWVFTPKNIKRTIRHGQSGLPRPLPFVVVRIVWCLCSRSGSYRLARLAAKYGRRISASPARRARTMTWSLCEARPSAPGLTRKSVRRAVVRPLEALLDPLALLADGLDDNGHFCTHLGSSFLWGER